MEYPSAEWKLRELSRAFAPSLRAFAVASGRYEEPLRSCARRPCLWFWLDYRSKGMRSDVIRARPSSSGNGWE